MDVEEAGKLSRKFLKNAREYLETVESLDIGLNDLLELQVSVFLNLGDASLYSFSAGEDDVTRESYSTLLRALELLKERELFINDPTLGLQLGYLKNLNVVKGFSLDRRLLGLGEPKPIQFWANRIVKLRALVDKIAEGYPSDPLYELGYGITPGDRKFPVLVKAVGRVFKLQRPDLDRALEFLLVALNAGIHIEPPELRNGKILDDVIEEPRTPPYVKTPLENVDVYYLFGSRKTLHTDWGSVELRKPDEVVIISKLEGKKRAYRLIRGAP